MVRRITLVLLLLCISPSAFGQGYLWWHKTPSTKADTSDATLIRPSDWNASLKPFPESSTFISDDFFAGSSAGGSVGELGWQVVITSSGLFGVIKGEANHPAIDTLTTGATSGGALALILSTSSTVGPLIPTNFFDMTFIIKLSQTDANTIVRVGAGNNTSSNPPNNGIYFEKTNTDTDWFGVCRSSSVQTRTAAISATGTTWEKMRIRLRDYPTDSVCFSIDGGTEVCLGTNKPTTALLPYVRILNNTTVAKNMYIDYFGLAIWPITR